MRQGIAYKDIPEVDDMIAPFLCKERKIMVYDGYNHHFPKDQRVCGSVLPRFSRNAPKNGYKIVEIEDFTYRVRKMLPKECFRLMGVSESDFKKIEESGISKTQQYKLAGNSIVVDVMAYLFERMFKKQLNEKVKITPPT